MTVIKSETGKIVKNQIIRRNKPELLTKLIIKGLYIPLTDG